MNKKIFDKITDIEDDTYFHIMSTAERNNDTISNTLLKLDDLAFLILEENEGDGFHCTLFLKNYYYDSMHRGAWGTISLDEIASEYGVNLHA